ncbi:hypothetical protein FIBSPDRAFT_955991, partial [Athelia psychrophila]
MHFSALAVLACALAASAAPARDHDDTLISIEAPIKVKDVGNGNYVGLLNNILKRGDVISAGIPIDISDVLNGNVITILDDLLGGGKRDLVDVSVPITIQDILNCNTIEIANHLLSRLASALKCTIEQLGVTAQDLLDCDASGLGGLISKILESVSHILKRHGGD